MYKHHLKLEKELFQFSVEKETFIYAPLLGVVLRANNALINLLCNIAENKPVDIQSNEGLFTKLESVRIINVNQTIKAEKIVNKIDRPALFKPTSVTLFLTDNCNLACKYCYANGGDKSRSMPIEIGFAAIDLLCDNAVTTGAQKIHLGFHGGGEPVLCLDNMKTFVAYATKLSQKNNLKLELGLTTNGVMSEDAALWIADNITQLNISFDGPEDIQNFHRPMRNNKNGYRNLIRTLKIFDKKKTNYHFRGTVTRFSQERIPEIVEFFVDNFSPVSIQLEPMASSGRSIETGIDSPDVHAFVKGFLTAREIAKQHQVKRFYFSGHRYPNICPSFCGIGEKNFAVTPEGKITSCFEVLGESDPRASTFLIGEYRFQEKKFFINLETNNYLRHLSLKEFDHCSDCFAKFHCAGDCLAKGLYLNDVVNFKGGGRCEYIQALLKEDLMQKFSAERGNHGK